MKKLSLLLIALLAMMSADAANAFYNVKDYGAKGDGSNIDSHAINTAIAALSTADKEAMMNAAIERQPDAE